ncbi:hypothetical protein AXK11_08645 [Cephaloticoccus primus]|uniref:Curli production assembly protein CsgG n=1 Tax=Cephaloticoccus primus TaxID=1548207 RepID=A0A139SIG2_9BACT|nr:CsgG/HfaB family protein [Cephaloticoccus primus]KXU34368.1 hypothetical protein AXK11_08645 [Cephaloticoccus primus]
MNTPRLREPLLAGFGLLLAISLGGCATEGSRALEVQQTRAATSAGSYRGERAPISVGKFDNLSQYMRGIFSDGQDRVGGQAQTILIGHLQRTGRFSVLDRSNLSEIAQEAGFNKKETQIKGARYVITGDVTEFGRKAHGDHQLWGVLGRGKKQVAYSKVTLNVVDTHTSEVVFSASGSGEYSLSNREVIGFGGTAGYDATLTGKVLDLSIREAVDGLITGLENGGWRL